MLVVNESTVAIRGRKLDLMAEFTALVHHLLNEDTFSEEDIDMCIKTAKKSDEEVEKEAKEALDKLLEKLLS